MLPVALFAGDVVALATPFTASSTLFAGTPKARYQLRASGDVFATSGTNASVDRGDWVMPKLSAPNYECFATLNSGVLSSGTTGAWLALTADRIWENTFSTDAVITVQIRRVGIAQVLATAVVTLHAELVT